MTKDSCSDSDGSIDDKSDVKKENMISCWQCPLCPMVYKRRFHFDKHVEAIHNLQPDEGAENLSILLPNAGWFYLFFFSE